MPADGGGVDDRLVALYRGWARLFGLVRPHVRPRAMAERMMLLLPLALAGGTVLAADLVPVAPDADLAPPALRAPEQLRADDDGRRFLVVAEPPRELDVCAQGCAFAGVADAIGAARPGDTVTIASGVYAEAAIVTVADLTLRAEPGARLEGVAAGKKAALVVKADGLTIEGLECSGIAVPDRNGACVRLEGGGDLTLRDVYFHDSESGLLGEGGAILIEDSRFERLGKGGRAHGIYVWGDSLTIRRSWMLAARDQAHEVKTRTVRTLIEHSLIASLDSDDSRLIDAGTGGDVTVRANVLQSGPRSANWELIGVGREGLKHAVNRAVIEDNLVLIDHPQGFLAGGPAELIVRGNTLVGGEPIADNRWYQDRAAAGLPPFPAVPLPE